MKFSKLDLLTLLISLFILNGCKNPDKIGLDVDPGDQLSGTLVADSNVALNTVLEDSVITVNQGRTPLGVFNDPLFGETESSLITDINLPGATGNSSSYTLPTGTIKIDSVIMQLKYSNNGFYGDSLNSTFKVNVYRVSERPSTTNYYNTKQWKPEGALLGTKTFTARVHDTLSIRAIVDGGPDTLTRVLPQLRIKLDSVRIYNMLFSDAVAIKSNLTFQTVNKGFYVSIDKAGSTGVGGIMTFAATDSIQIYTRITASDNTVDTTVILMPLLTYISQIKHTYSNTITEALNSTATSNQQVYIQGMAGLRAKVKFPDFKTTLPKDIVINRAELVLTPVAGTVTPYAPLPAMMLYKLDLAKQRTFIEDAIDQTSGFNTVFGGFYGLPVKNEYHFLITSYVQNLVSGKTKDYGVYIGASSDAATSVNINAQAYPIQRSVLYGKNSPYRAKVNIIYTTLK